MSLAAIQRAATDPDDVREIFKTVMEVPALRGECWNITSAEVVEQALCKIAAHTGNTDPFHADKEDQNRRLMAIYPLVEQNVAGSATPLVAALKYAVSGNAIDFMVSSQPSEKVGGLLSEMGSVSIEEEDAARFFNKLQRSRTVVYIGDNAGEAVLDKLFIATLKAKCHLEVFYVVRSRPALNDVTREDAALIGLSEVARVVENGVDGSLPGTILQRCSAEMRELVERADLIISKGGGNFETLSEEDGLRTDITFLLLSKCRIFNEYFRVPLNQPIVANFFGGRVISTDTPAAGGG
jgi:uncharacterized protein with ATP-grasp and redox domains